MREAPGLDSTRRRPRNGVIDAVRVIAIVAVAWFHADMPWSNVGVVGFFALTALAVALLPASFVDRSISRLLHDRAIRLLVPWGIWCVLYAGLRVASAVAEGAGVLAWFEPRMVLYGTWIHLWFLPFLFVLTAAIALASRPKMLQQFLTAIGAVLLLSYPLLISEPVRELGSPFVQWALALPGAGAGLLLRAAGREGKSALWLLGGCLVAATGVAWAMHGLLPALELLGGIVLALAAWRLWLPATNAVVMAGRLTMGVYLFHPIPLVLMARVVEPGLNVVGLAGFAVSILVSFGAAAVLLKVAPWMLGEFVRSKAPQSPQPTAKKQDRSPELAS